MKVLIGFIEHNNVESVEFPDGYPNNRYIWLKYPYKTTNFNHQDYLKFDYEAIEITNKTYIKISKK